MLHGHEPNQRGYPLQPAATEITGKSHPDKLKALVGELKRRDLFYLTKNLISDQEEGNGNAQPYILRKYAKQNRLGVGDLKIVKKDDVTSEAADAQVKRDSLLAKGILSAHIPQHDFEEMGGYDAEVKDIWDKFLRYPYQGLDELEVQDKARENLDNAVGDTKLLLSDYSKYLRAIQMLLTYNATMFHLDDDTKNAERRRVMIKMNRNLPEKFNDAYREIRSMMKGGNDVTWQQIKHEFATCVDRERTLDKQRDSLDEAASEEKHVEPQAGDTDRPKALATTTNPFQNRQDKGKGGDWGGNRGARTRGAKDGAGRRRNELKCYICKKPGHIAKQCKHKEAHEKFLANLE
jgi:hypothetical protein